MWEWGRPWIGQNDQEELVELHDWWAFGMVQYYTHCVHVGCYKLTRQTAQKCSPELWLNPRKLEEEEKKKEKKNSLRNKRRSHRGRKKKTKYILLLTFSPKLFLEGFVLPFFFFFSFTLFFFSFFLFSSRPQEQQWLLTSSNATCSSLQWGRLAARGAVCS